MAKGRARRYREVRELKRGVLPSSPGSSPLSTSAAGECVECGQNPHASWCLAEEAVAGADGDQAER